MGAGGYREIAVLYYSRNVVQQEQLRSGKPQVIVPSCQLLSDGVMHHNRRRQYIGKSVNRPFGSE